VSPALRRSRKLHGETSETPAMATAGGRSRCQPMPAPGAGIGWHRDRPPAVAIAGVSLVSPCSFRLRRKAGETWERATIEAQPRSAYLMSGPARSEWQHSIPPVEALRYSVTFRTVHAPRPSY
jgi:hypothetical protein